MSGAHNANANNNNNNCAHKVFNKKWALINWMGLLGQSDELADASHQQLVATLVRHAKDPLWS